MMTMLVTGSFLYFGPLSALVGRREMIKTIHVYCGLMLPIPVLLGLLSIRFRADGRRLGRLDDEDWKWLKSWGRRGRVAKFNAGQKLNAAFVVGAIPVMLATGSIMRWFKPFPLSWRTGATFVHDWVFLAPRRRDRPHRQGARGPDRAEGHDLGRVPAGWARSNRPRWLEGAGI
jgi:formate dehydrogenase subunit gamma